MLPNAGRAGGAARALYTSLATVGLVADGRAQQLEPTPQGDAAHSSFSLRWQGGGGSPPRSAGARPDGATSSHLP
eukprot:4340967-Pyramimonas_sp.AAC.1